MWLNFSKTSFLGMTLSYLCVCCLSGFYHVVVRVFIKPEGSITVALVWLALPPGPTIPPESLDVQQQLQKVFTEQAPEVRKPELWLTFQKGVHSASPLQYSWLESLKLLPRVGKTDGQTQKPHFC